MNCLFCEERKKRKKKRKKEKEKMKKLSITNRWTLVTIIVVAVLVKNIIYDNVVSAFFLGLPRTTRITKSLLPSFILQQQQQQQQQQQHHVPWNIIKTTTTTTSTTTTTINAAAAAGDGDNDQLPNSINNLAVQVAEKVQPWVVLVTPKGVRNMTARGSGFVLRPSDIPTSLLRRNQQSQQPQQQLHGNYTNTNNITNNSSDNSNNNDSSLCSFPPLYVITAAHVALPGYTIEITLLPPQQQQQQQQQQSARSNMINLTTEKLSATVVARNTTLDLALLRVDTSTSTAGIAIGTPDATLLQQDGQDANDNNNNINIHEMWGLSLARELPLVGTWAFGHGYPASRVRGPVMTFGIVCGIADGLGIPDDNPAATFTTTTTTTANTNTMLDTTIYVVTDAALSGGMSGGPLVDSTGTVVGVNALIRPDLRALGQYAVSSVEVVQFLKSIDDKNNNNDNDDDNDKARISKNGNEKLYKVWLYNDPMNKRVRVSQILRDVAMFNTTQADDVMMKAHTTGRGLVGNFTNETQAATLCQALRQQDLLVEME